ncbi:flagellar hook-associated protein FlgL [Paenibacillus sp. CGMCC 1.16610]|uniref:Flagellar hook-associated protein FlgL n=1 Tax=Paenibacillus anseongense TaxID=2682845 RepID=A0ABW9U5T6_9BACL|nr:MULTISPECIES: flagellar hook-associated protein FlgL [Paenibacillus]MBA2942409.1 flagellar hook-associated protein FlgL [Paenibacillus sp. CGMCC 1.16610]MVQ34484.1 flagellar hook-associated protein FlgL [Paenibacillus anseongense]
MSLRVTQSMIQNQLISNINKNMINSDKLQTQLATGRKINKPSDDPVGITYALRYRSELSSNEQYTTNVDAAHSWMDYSDALMDESTKVLQRTKELAVQAGAETNPQSALDSIKLEIDQLKEQLVQNGNSKLNGKYVFNGQKYDEKPYESATASSIPTNDGGVTYEVGTGVTLDVNVTGNQVFGKPGESDQAFALLERLSTALKNGDFSGINNELPNIDTRLEKIATARAEMGAKTNRVELMQDRLSTLEVNLTDLQSKTEDVDYAKAVMLQKINENIYEASLSAGSKIISPSLIDFLR